MEVLDSIESKISVKIEDIWLWALAHKQAMAMYHLPNSNYVQLIASENGAVDNINIDFDDEKSGFAISKYGEPNAASANFINADINLKFFSNSNGKFFDTAIVFNDTYQNTWLNKVKNVTHGTETSAILEPIFTANNNFEALVAKAVVEIQKGNMHKVVLSRQKVFHTVGQINTIKVFEKLYQKYPRAFVSMTYLPHVGEIWIGASPELLISIDKDGLFQTMALAGTQSAIDTDGEPIDASEARWSQKEIEEQAMVSRYIIDCFKKVRVREYIENGPKTVKAGQLLHLQTDYIVDTKAIDFQYFATAMLGLLNPTSAVCGMPKSEAVQFLANNEGYERSYYSGFLGPKNIDGASSLFVNLRTMSIKDQMAYFYAGAGITADSKPAKEWRETELKINTLLSVFANDNN